MFSENSNKHSSSYVELFNGIVFSDVCWHVPEFRADYDKCKSYNQGILLKGIYISTIKLVLENNAIGFGSL